jgi:hypothetical protein
MPSHDLADADKAALIELLRETIDRDHLDRDLQRKPAWYALAEAFARAPTRERGSRREHSTADAGRVML